MSFSVIQGWIGSDKEVPFTLLHWRSVTLICGALEEHLLTYLGGRMSWLGWQCINLPSGVKAEPDHQWFWCISPDAVSSLPTDSLHRWTSGTECVVWLVSCCWRLERIASLMNVVFISRCLRQVLSSLYQSRPFLAVVCRFSILSASRCFIISLLLLLLWLIVIFDVGFISCFLFDCFHFSHAIDVNTYQDDCGSVRMWLC